MKNTIFDLKKNLLILDGEEFFFPVNPFHEKVIYNGIDLQKEMNEVVFTMVNGNVNINDSYKDEVVKAIVKTRHIQKSSEKIKSFSSFDTEIQYYTEKYDKIRSLPLAGYSDRYRGIHNTEIDLHRHISEFLGFFDTPLIIVENYMSFGRAMKGDVPHCSSYVAYKKTPITLKRIEHSVEVLRNDTSKYKYRFDKDRYKDRLFVITNKDFESDLVWSLKDYNTTPKYSDIIV